jgi:glycine C-acetyltransferase/8-amino-7-oxononanoate synthase
LRPEVLGPELRAADRTRIVHEGRKLLFFGGNDYHRLSSHPEVVEAARSAAAEHGLGSAGSRMTTGNHPLYLRLEERAAAFLGGEEAVVFSSGYLAGTVIVQAVKDSFDRIVIDSAAHSSLTGASLEMPRDRIHPFEHASPEDLERTVRRTVRGGEKFLLLTDGAFPGSGEIPPLREYLRIAGERGGALLVDDAHALATVGRTGKGTWEEMGIPAAAVLQAGTLSKGFGAFGGVVAGSRDLIEKIRGKSLAFTGSTGIPLPLAAAGIRAIGVLEAHPEMISGLQVRMAAVKASVRAMGLPAPESPAPILSVSLGNEDLNLRLRRLLLERGIYPPFIHYPGSPPGGHFRFTFSSVHTDEEVEMLLGALRSACV